MSFRSHLSISALLILTSISACGGDEDELFSLRVPYQLGAGLSCEQAKVNTVRVVLGAAREQVFEHSCDNLGELALVGVQKGTWPIAVEGVDAQGATIMGSTVQSPKARVEVIGDGAITQKLTLANLPAKIEIRWNLGYGDCASFNLGDFQVGAWDVSGATQLMGAAIPCNAPMIADMYRAVPDPAGALNGANLKVITVQPRLPDAQALGPLLRAELPNPPGPGYVVRLGLLCDPAKASCILSEPASISPN